MNNLIRGPFFGTVEDAAKYCGMSRTAFGKLKKKYLIPKNAGPGKKQYAASDLDAFMADPEQFKLTKRQKNTNSISLDEMGIA
ncbi:protein of unknown function [Maridesulfovibrio hydrothermalis AM13 = DSM 14728]|uniref:Helix-turn-helix domain-containing protein n=2 Tax=Maridesulfovibrio TaxID=2794998 RepID=L0R9L1_9BACT|nr:protein of unknown function [Maridesulfovibrio hydrothermalis AM13 = DSM 14728]